MKRTFGLLCVLLSLLAGSALAKTDVILDWNTIAVNTAVANKQNPFAQARYAAIVQLAVCEAVNSITHDYQPYLGTINALPDASPDAAAIEAAYEVLAAYFPASQGTLYTAYLNSMGSIPDGRAKTDGILSGHNAALAMMALRANDGSSPAQFASQGQFLRACGRRRPVVQLSMELRSELASNGRTLLRSAFRVPVTFCLIRHPRSLATNTQRLTTKSRRWAVSTAHSGLLIGLMSPCSTRLLHQLRCSIRPRSRSQWHRAGPSRRMHVLSPSSTWP